MKQFVLKIIRMRKAMIKHGFSKKNKMRMIKAIKRFDNYLSYYPNASEAAIKNYCRKHYDDLIALMPGRGSSSYEKLQKELTQQLNN